MPVLLTLLLLISQTNFGQEYTAKRGDIISVTVWERPSLSGTVVVDSNGNITLPIPIGAVYVLGMTATEISRILTDKVKEYVVNPTIFVSITPSEGFIVHVLGEVKSPDFIKVPDGTTIQEVITKAGGFTEFSDKQNIRLIRKLDDFKDGKTTEIIVDITKFIKEGDLLSNPTVKPGDTLIVPRMPEKTVTSNRIMVYGAVSKPGIVEIEEPQSLSTIIAMVGGLLPRSNPSEISIVRISDDDVLQKTVNFEDFIIGKNYKANPTISPGEMVFVPEKVDEKPFDVNVIGQIV
ncbi:MAG: polysaccharide biosynthesis/export family protein, partial [Candidatus Poribacteria bacterium]